MTTLLQKNETQHNIGISLILTNADWKRYADLSEKRMVKYELFISKDPENFDTTVDAIYQDIYTDQTDKGNITVSIRELVDGNEREPILPNTVYYIKAAHLSLGHP